MLGELIAWEVHRAFFEYLSHVDIVRRSHSGMELQKRMPVSIAEYASRIPDIRGENQGNLGKGSFGIV